MTARRSAIRRALGRGGAAVVLTVALLAAGCGNDDEGADGSGAPAPTAAAPTGAPDGGGGEVPAPDSPTEPATPGESPDPESPAPEPGTSVTAAPGEEEPEPAPPTPTPTPGPTEPLTGEPLVDPSIMNRPALAVKIGNSSVGRPQTGINEADVLIEVRVETITRLIAVFHSQGADPLGPVRSARSSDPDILANFSRPAFGHSGANPGVLREVSQGQSAGKLYELRWDHLPPDYWRVGDRAAPFNVYTTTSAIWDAAPSELSAPEPLFEYRREGEELPASAEPVPGVEVRYLGGTVAHFAWDAEAGRFARWQDGTPHVDSPRHPGGALNRDVAPVQVTPANVVVLQTRYRGSSPCPSCPQALTADPEGGVALVFTDGHMIRGRWTRPSADQPWQVTDNDGNPVRLTPGQTFIALPGGDVLVLVKDFADNLLRNR